MPKITIDDDKPNDEPKPGSDYCLCRGCFALGSGCGKCLRCKAEAWDWLCKNSKSLEYWTVMVTGRHGPMEAVIQKIQEEARR